MTNNINRLRFNSPGLFSPSFVRDLDGKISTELLSFSDIGDRHIGTTSSFRYDPPGSGLKSTQQIGVDFSKFENHTFFNSARINVNIALSKIINEFPFAGTRKEIEQFLDSLTGYQKYIYDNFPKNKGFLFFSSSYITINYFAGIVFPTLSTNQTGDSVLNPHLKSMTWEMQLYLPTITNENQTVCQKISGSNQAISLFVSRSASTSTATLLFAAVSGSSKLETSATLTKGQFNHIAATFDRRPSINKLQLFVAEELINESNNSINFNEIDFNVSPFTIGSGSAVAITGGTFTPQQTLSGAIDEFRFFHERRTIPQQEKYVSKEIFPDDDVVLYFKFNEPTGSIGDTITDDSVVLDYSKNSLHSLITGFAYSLRSTSSVNSPMSNEDIDLCPVLFPQYGETQTLNSDLLISASYYDASNPNLITRLVPAHYFLEGSELEALADIDGYAIGEITGDNLPNTAQVGQAQVLQTLLYIWAQYFDELKIYIDNFSKILNVEYDGIDAVPDILLNKVAEYYGFKLPNLFTDATFSQFVDKEEYTVDGLRKERNLQSIQNQIWRRILVNLKEIIQSKGTIHSIKSFIRTIGIDPDSNFRIREYGGMSKVSFSQLQRETRSEVSTMLDMSGSSTLLTSPYLSSSRTEIGFPNIRGSYVSNNTYYPHGISNNINDGFLTSGSFAVEGIFKFPINRKSLTVQSLFRLQTTGSSAFIQPGLVLNVIAISGTSDATNKIEMYTRPGASETLSSSLLLKLELTGVNIFDGDKWNVAFGRFRNDDYLDYLSEYPDLSKSNISSSYYLYVGKSGYDGMISNLHFTQSFFQEIFNETSYINCFQSSSTVLNVSGVYIAIGSSSLNTGTSVSASYLNNTNIVTASNARETRFDGLVSNIRFWSKGLLLDEWKEHVRNYKSIGVKDPSVNFSFNTYHTGAWNRLRLDVSTEQNTTASNGSGIINLFDYSQNNFHMTGTNFESSVRVIDPETYYFSYLSPKFDEAATTNKVRVRSFQDENNVKEFGGVLGSVYQVPPNEEPIDDPRFTIDFSVIDALNQDIINIFSTLDKLDNFIGEPRLQFVGSYPDLTYLRSIYFNRLTEKIKLQSFFEFFKWFDSNIGNFIFSLLKKEARFRGINFLIESHMLERAKFENMNLEQYFNIDSERNGMKRAILINNIVGEGVRKF